VLIVHSDHFRNSNFPGGMTITNIFDFLEPEFKTGSIIVATLNLVVYGCNREQGLVYCMNPLDPYNIDLFEGFLSTQSVLLIRKEDVLKRLQIEGGDYSILRKSYGKTITFQNKWRLFDEFKRQTHSCSIYTRIYCCEKSLICICCVYFV
jgi:hypothetical protein